MATYYEIAVKGDDKELASYLRGFMAGTGVTGIHILSEGGFHLKSIRERLKHHGEVQHIICGARQRTKLRAAIEKGAERFGFEIISEDKIKRAHFEFDFKTPSREVAKAIKKALASLPQGIKADYTADEAEDPGAVGAEMYSPAHDYEFRGKGEIQGDPGAVVEARRELDEIEFVKVHEIKLDHA